MPRALHSDEFKREAVALAVSIGPAEAARQLDMKAPTLRSWCSRAGVATDATANTEAATALRRARWEERRSEMVHDIGDAAAKALDKVLICLDQDSPRNAKDYATTMAILVDKAQLLSGGHTARFGSDADRAAVLGEAHGRGLALVKSA